MSDYKDKSKSVINGFLAGRSLQSGFNTRIFGCAGLYFALVRWILNESYLEPSHPHRHLIVCDLLYSPKDVMEPLQAGGYEQQQIQRLGELS